MSNLSELMEYPSIIALKLINSKSILDLLLDEIDTPCPNDTILNNNVYAYDYTPEIIENNKTLICIDTNVSKVSSKSIKDLEIYFWVCVHYDKMPLDPKFKLKGNRRDNICNEIDKLMNGSRDFGIGQVQLRPTRLYKPTKDYTGRFLTYTIADFNQDRNIQNG